MDSEPESHSNKPAAKRKVIVITDGDQIARKSVETAARQVGARVISRSAGNPSPLYAKQLVKLVLKAKHDPVIVMFDDNGDEWEGVGEKTLLDFIRHPAIEVIGAIAVAANTTIGLGTKVDFSLDRDGNMVYDGVNKDGYPLGLKRPVIVGDTVDVLRKLNVPIVVGMGDIGKMQGNDAYYKGAPITTAAIMEILKRSGFDASYSNEYGHPAE